MKPTGWLAPRYLSQMKGTGRFGEHPCRSGELRDGIGQLKTNCPGRLRESNDESGFGWGVILRFSTLRLGPGEARPPGPPKALICNNSDDSTVKQNERKSPPPFPPSGLKVQLLRNQITAYPKTSFDMALHKYIRIRLYALMPKSL
jgi:hypothetical protein